MINNRKLNPIPLLFIAIIAVLLIFALIALNYFNLLPQKTYSAEDFDITTVKSSVDFDGDGVDDYTDIMLGARADAENKPRYDGAYVAGGYPADDVGVCTDVVWRAFKNAGYNLRAMVDSDIAARPEAYENIEKPDSNIDFRRVPNLHTFFKEHAISLTTDINKINEWQPGDIIIFRNDKHIGIVSDIRNRDGQTYIIHNGGQPDREEDYLKRAEVVAHYRFDAALLPNSILIEWTE